MNELVEEIDGLEIVDDDDETSCVLCCMYGNDEIYIYYSAINIIINSSIT